MAHTAGEGTSEGGPVDVKGCGQVLMLEGKVRILCDKPTSINLDGELRVAETVDFSIAEEKLRFFYPKGLVWTQKQPAAIK